MTDNNNYNNSNAGWATFGKVSLALMLLGGGAVGARQTWQLHQDEVRAAYNEGIRDGAIKQKSGLDLAGLEVSHRVNDAGHYDTIISSNNRGLELVVTNLDDRKSFYAVNARTRFYSIEFSNANETPNVNKK